MPYKALTGSRTALAETCLMTAAYCVGVSGTSDTAKSYACTVKLWTPAAANMHLGCAA